ncbi:MAG: GAF domain-containing protein [Candidatus Omnitrophica bacterium]|nr:GAF domain-containing protein [Candidatus Omnitrophota bacterium]
MLLAAFFGFTGGAFAFSPVFNIRIFPYGMFFVILYPCLMTYAISKYHLLDITLALNRGMKAVLVAVVSIGISLWIEWYVRTRNLDRLWWLPVLVCAMTVVIGVLVFMRWLLVSEKKRIKHLVNLHEAAQEIFQHKRLDTLSRAVVHSFQKILRLEHAALYLRKGENYELMSAWHPGQGNWKDHLLGQWSHHSPLVRRLMKLLEQATREFYLERERLESWEEVGKQMDELKARIVVPVGTLRRMYGFFCLGPTIQGRVLEKEELEQLRFLADQVVLAVENIEAMDRLEQYQQYEAEQQRVLSIGKLNSVLMHLINNPLMLVCGFAQQVMITLQKNGAAEEILQKLKTIQERGMQASQVLRAVMEYVHHSTEQEMEPARLKVMVEEVIEELKKQAEWGKIQTKIQAQDLGEVFGDTGQIKEVVKALLVKQAEWLKWEGEIEIGLSSRGEEVLLTVANRRTTVEEKEIEELFAEPKYVSPQHHVKGTGLEMYLGKMIVVGHRGEIGCENTPPSGTSFWARLPQYNGKRQKGLWRKPR